MPHDDDPLDALRQALTALDEAEKERARAWAYSGTGLLDPPEGRRVRMEAEREVEHAREALWRAKEALVRKGTREKEWSAH